MATMKCYHVDVDYQDETGALLNDAETVYAPTPEKAAAQVTKQYKRGGYEVVDTMVEEEEDAGVMASYLSQFETDGDEADDEGEE